MIPLCFAKPNKDFCIKEIRGLKEEKCCLMEKGLCVGNKIRVMENSKNCFVVKVNDNIKYALSFGIANKIILQDL